MSADRLPDELRDLGRALPWPPVDDDAVARHVVAQLTRMDAERHPANRPRRRWRPAMAGAAAVLIVLALTQPVRAAVVDWFGVIIRPGPVAEEGPAPPANSGLTLEAAAEVVAFEPVLPDALGPPDGVEVSADGRVLSLSWAEPRGVLRLDQFDGRLGPAFVKHADAVEVDLGGNPAVWFNGPHHLTTIDSAGREHTDATRSAGPTLIWQRDDITLRLEGAELERAVKIARSVRGTR